MDCLVLSMSAATSLTFDLISIVGLRVTTDANLFSQLFDCSSAAFPRWNFPEEGIAQNSYELYFARALFDTLVSIAAKSKLAVYGYHQCNHGERRTCSHDHHSTANWQANLAEHNAPRWKTNKERSVTTMRPRIGTIGIFQKSQSSGRDKCMAISSLTQPQTWSDMTVTPRHQLLLQRHQRKR